MRCSTKWCTADPGSSQTRSSDTCRNTRRPARSSCAGNAFHEPRDRLLQLGVNDARISADQPQRRRRVEQSKNLGWRDSSLSVRSEKIRYRNTQNIGDALKPSGADAICAFLVFLDLLEGQSQLIAEFFLRYSLLQAKRPHALPNLDIQRIRTSFRHLGSPQRVKLSLGYAGGCRQHARTNVSTSRTPSASNSGNRGSS